MASAEIYKVFCVIAGEDRSFPVKIPLSESVDDLKKYIKDEIYNFARIDARHLKLYHVELPDEGNILALVEGLQPPLTARSRLKASMEMGDLFPDGPTKGVAHIIVCPPLINKAITRLQNPKSVAINRLLSRPRTTLGSKPAPISPSISLRKDTVLNLFELLLEHNLVQVCGPPESGKSVLLNLLHHYIMEKQPNSTVFVFKDWPEDQLYHLNINDRFRHYFPTFQDVEIADDHFYLFDESHTTYWDDDLWYLFKNTFQGAAGRPRAILFCQYSREDLDGTRGPMNVKIDGRAEVKLDRWMDAGHGTVG